MTIDYDHSATSVVIRCTECTYWFAFRFDRDSAYRAGEDHLIRVHDIAPDTAANARHSYESRRARHAASS